jgi:hypothetical protein
VSRGSRSLGAAAFDVLVESLPMEASLPRHPAGIT